GPCRAAARRGRPARIRSPRPRHRRGSPLRRAGSRPRGPRRRPACASSARAGPRPRSTGAPPAPAGRRRRRRRLARPHPRAALIVLGPRGQRSGMARPLRIVFHARLMLRLVSLFGVLVLVALCWLASKHRRAVSWRLVAVGVAMQFAIGGLFVAWSTGRDALYRFGEGVRDFLALSAAGTRFVFGPLADGAAGSSLGFVLATQ